MNIKDIIDSKYTQINKRHIKLHKIIDDNDLLVSYQYNTIHIFDRNDIAYLHNNNLHIYFYQTPRTDYYEKYLKLYNDLDNYIYPYLKNKTIEEIQQEDCYEIKYKNKLFNENSERRISFIIKLEKEENEYYLCYYMKNTILKNITFKKRFILKELLSNLEKQKLLNVHDENLENLMNPYNYITQNNTSEDHYSHEILKNDVTLYNYQKNDINWMINLENMIINNENHIDYKYSIIQPVLNNEYVLINDQIMPATFINTNYNTTEEFYFYGGNLISEVGLGKTIIMLYHILNDKQFIEKRESFNKFVEFSYNCNYFYKRGTNKGLACDKECIDNKLFCKEHDNTLFVDKRHIIYKNLSEFNPDDFICKKLNKIKLNSTLIICPNHLCDQWVREYYEKFKNDKRVLLLITKDQFNNLTLGDLLFSDIVITSYNILTSKWYIDLYAYDSLSNNINNFKLNNDLPLRQDQIVKLFLEKKEFNEFSLFHWNRVVLDEAHELTKIYKYNYLNKFINDLSSNFKWNITGTPFSNGLEGYLNLMKYNTSFKVNNNISNFTYTHLLNLHLNSDIILKSRFLFKRNTKKYIENEIQQNIINQYLKLLEFTDEERSIYSSYEKGNKTKFSEFLIKLCCHCELNENTKTLIKKCQSLNEIKHALLDYNKNELESLNNKKELLINNLNKETTKLENLENDISIRIQNINFSLPMPFVSDLIEICKNNISNYKRQITTLNKSIDTINRTYNYLKKSVESTEKETCTICLDTINEVETTITKCGHKFCWDCIHGLFTLNVARNCPNCKTPLNINDIYLYSNDTSTKINNNENIELNDIIQEVKSTKIGNIIYFLKQLMNSENINNNNKIIIFSQWDTLLEKAGDFLEKYNLQITHCKGTVYQKKRAIKEFSTNKDKNIIMLSSRFAASGINLTMANKIILLEPVYGNKEYRTNIENQAIGRSDRIGQKKPIDVYRFIIKDSIEEDIINDNIKEDEIPHITF